MTKTISSIALLLAISSGVNAQGPAITSWLQNTTIYGRHYVSGNSTPIQDNVLSNTQIIEYSTDWVYVHTHGIPTYVTGPYLDGNPSVASDQNAIFKFPLAPTHNTGTPTATSLGNIGVFINGVAMFDSRDAASWKTSTSAMSGGTFGGGPGDGIWNRDAIPAERAGFDCAKGHPAMGNYHHHQNPSAFDLDLQVISTVCNLYDADGLYAIDSTVHSPLIGFAYDGFPIYGAYGYENANGTGNIVRIKSSYTLRNITVRNTYYDGSSVTAGPAVNSTYPIGYFREDYGYTAPTSEDYLDEHNGRFCVTPEYPAGIYCYFATVDENWNSAYPYMVGPTFYGNKVAAKVTSVSETTTVYESEAGITQNELENMSIEVFPNPATDLVAIQINGLLDDNLTIELVDLTGRAVQSGSINAGSTIAYFDTEAIGAGEYVVRIASSTGVVNKKLTLVKN